MSLLSRIFGNRDSEILCPHCERSMESGHDLEACARKRMSRRFFFGVMAGAAVAVSAPQLIWPTSPIETPGNILLTVEPITNEALLVLQRNLMIGKQLKMNWESSFADPRDRIGDVIHVRRPRNL